MKWTCLFYDLVGGFCEDLAVFDALDADLNLEFIQSTPKDNKEKLFYEKSEVAAIVVVADENSPELERILATFSHEVGPFPDFQLVIASDPSPVFLANIFEYGLEQIINRENWEGEVADFLFRVKKALCEDDSIELKCMKANQAVKKSSHPEIIRWEKELEAVSSYNYKAALTRARALEATGKYKEGLMLFRCAEPLNKMFLPIKSGLGELLLLSGQTDEAISLFEELEGKNGHCFERKLHLANAYSQRGDFELAREHIKKAASIFPDSSKLVESKIHLFLGEKKIKEAIKLMDGLDEVGPHLTSKLNDLGVKLSQSGNGKSALILYNKAHKLVPKELRYKVSLNAALACYRTKDFHKSIQYIKRCRDEYGDTFPKLIKLYKAVQNSMEDQSA